MSIDFESKYARATDVSNDAVATLGWLVGSRTLLLQQSVALRGLSVPPPPHRTDWRLVTA